jgi:prepilin-type N-terminal cleavage/methylation domain-containing protein
MKKRAFSLIEMVIALGLLSLLLSTLLFWYHSLTQKKTEFNRLKGPLMEERYAYQRLQNLLPKAELPLFTIELGGGVLFVFDKGVDVKPELSGRVVAYLYHDEATHSLCLSLWPYSMLSETPSVPPPPILISPLLNGVEACSFHFYLPPDPFRQPVNPEEVGRVRPSEGWQQRWADEYNKLPAMVKICITRNAQEGCPLHTFEYLFDLPLPVIYPKPRLS